MTTNLLRFLLLLSSILSCTLWLYYYMVMDIKTSIAHVGAVFLGVGCALLVLRTPFMREGLQHSYYTALVDTTSTSNRVQQILQPVTPLPIVAAEGTESTHLEVKESWIRGAEKGLFASAPMAKGQLVCRYTGQSLATAEAMRTTDKSYLMRLGAFTYVDARESPLCLARYINDCRNPLGYNVVFHKKPADRSADVVALRDIDLGEELFADYGKWYWSGLAPSRLTLAELMVRRGIATR